VTAQPAEGWTVLRGRLRERHNGRCERCDTYLPQHAWSAHHRRPKGAGGTRRADVHTLPNLLALCGSGTTGCHGWVESNRTLALTWGFLVPQAADPAKMPVLLGGRLWVLLTPDGAYEVSPEPLPW